MECEGGSEDDEVEAMTVEDADFLATECEIESERIKANEGMQIEEDFFEDLEMSEVSEKELSEDLLYDDMSIDEKIMLQGLKAPLDTPHDSMFQNSTVSNPNVTNTYVSNTDVLSDVSNSNATNSFVSKTHLISENVLKFFPHTIIIT